MRDLYMKNGEGFILVYSVISPATLEDLKTMHTQICVVKDNDKVPMILCGNKSDLEDSRIVETETGEALANEWGCPFMETSAKTKANLDAAFQNILKQVIDDREAKNPPKKKKRRRCIIMYFLILIY